MSSTLAPSRETVNGGTQSPPSSHAARVYERVAVRISVDTAKAVEHRVTAAHILLVQVIEESRADGNFAVIDRIITSLQAHRAVESAPLPLTRELICRVASSERRVDAARDLELSEDSLAHRTTLDRAVRASLLDQSELRSALSHATCCGVAS